MSCCGEKRAYFRQIAATSGPAVRAAQDAPPYDEHVLARVVFEYTGATGLTVVCPDSGRRYRFDRPGARVVIDPRDRLSLSAVPHLRQVGI